jgi:methionine-gamma-lyase
MMSYGYDPMLSEGAVKPPIFQTSTFVFESAEAGKAFFEVAYGLRAQGKAEQLGLIYSRLNNPDLEVLEDRLTLWDDAEACAVFESGMAAITTALLAFVRPGDFVVHSEPLYGGSEHFLRNILPDFNVTPVAFTAGHPVAEVEQSIRSQTTGGRVSAVLIETPANPTNALVDIAEVVKLAQSLNGNDDKPVVMVDNTFLGPMWQHPLEHGADLVLYSAMAGPWTGWLLLRSLETLKMRMTAQMKNARYVVDYLNEHPKIRRVHYLDLMDEEDEMYPVYRRQCLGPGSMVAFEVEGGEPGAFRLLNALQLIKLAVSLGGTESLAEHPATMTHADIPAADQERMGIGPSMVRLSLGVEHYEDIIADLEQALAAV